MSKDRRFAAPAHALFLLVVACGTANLVRCTSQDFQEASSKHPADRLLVTSSSPEHPYRPGSPRPQDNGILEAERDTARKPAVLKTDVVNSLHDWLEHVAQSQIGAVVDETEVGNPMSVLDRFLLTPGDAFQNAGFYPETQLKNIWRREVFLDRAAGIAEPSFSDLVLSSLPTLPYIDCIAISSISRPGSDKVYLYETLDSIFRAFPKEAQVNVLVGNKNSEYVEEANLRSRFGEEGAARIHVWPTPDDVSDYLASLPIAKRGGWNFARGLLKYHGKKGLILLEDDVEWASDGAALLQESLMGTTLPIVSLYNQSCEDLPGRRRVSNHGRLSLESPSRDFGIKWYSQGFWVAPEITQALGEHQFIHMNGFCWDGLINTFLEAHGLDSGYCYPSLIQHRGVVSTGPWHEHVSRCFLDDDGGEARVAE